MGGRNRCTPPSGFHPPSMSPSSHQPDTLYGADGRVVDRTRFNLPHLAMHLCARFSLIGYATVQPSPFASAKPHGLQRPLTTALYKAAAR